MKKFSHQSGILGSTLGVLAGLIELSIAFLGLLLCPVLLPGILAQVDYAPGYPTLLKSLGWGWYASAIGTGLILVAGFLRRGMSGQNLMKPSAIISDNKQEA